MESKVVQLSCIGALVEGNILPNSPGSSAVFAVDITVNNNVAAMAKEEPQQVPKDVLMVVDVSGSMSGTEPQLISTILEVGKALNPHDRLSVVLFESEGRVLFPLQKIGQIDHLTETVQGIRAGGGTDITSGIITALDHLTGQDKTGVSSEMNVKMQVNEQDKKKKMKEDKEHEEGSGFVMIMVLSDGQTSDRETLVPTVLNKLALISDYQIIFHSFGFTSNHDHEVLQSLTTLGNCGTGLYYTFQLDTDIVPAIGDCLGSSSSTCVHGLSLRAFIEDDGNMTPCAFFHGHSSLSSESDGEEEKKDLLVEKFGTLANGEQHTAIIVCKDMNKPAKIHIRLSYTYAGTQELCEDSIECAFPSTISQPEITKETHVKTHLLRLRVGAALCRLIDSASLSIPLLISSLEELHAVLISEIENAQLHEGEVNLVDENILVSLEQDLGEALERINKSQAGIVDSRLRGRFLQFAHEHLHQRSASTKSNVRSTYATPEQLAMRLRFLSSADPTWADKDKVTTEKAALPIEEEGVTAEQADKRRQVDEEVTCYISLCNWREAEMGIGLLVKPRTMRERYKKLMPNVTIVPDYISAASFNKGVKAAVEQVGSVLDRENEEFGEEEHTMVKSSSRGRINAWLPLYINATHWKSAKTYAPSALSIIATQYNDMFQPLYALKVCSKLMIANVVKFTIQDQIASEKAIQMYCDIHRLFLEMTKEYPDIITQADAEIKQFIETPSKRIRSVTPDLGDLILYLTVTPNYSWQDLKKPYVLESFRRSSRFVKATAGHVPLQSIPTEEELFEYWMKGTNGGKVTMFNILFLNLIARPPNTTPDDVARTYDMRWGKLSDEALSALKQGYDEIMRVTQLPEVLEKLGLPMPNDAIAELVLWAFENKDETGKVGWINIPTKGGERVKEWRERVELYNLVKNSEEVPSLPPYSPLNHRKPRQVAYTGVAEMLESLSVSPSSVFNQDCTCHHCNQNRHRRECTAQWNQHIVPQHLRVDHPVIPSHQIFVGGLPKKISPTELKEELQKAISGAKHIDVIVDTKSGQPKGYAFVELEDEDTKQSVLKQKLIILRKELIVDNIRGLGQDPSFLPSYLQQQPRSSKVDKEGTDCATQ